MSEAPSIKVEYPNAGDKTVSQATEIATAGVIGLGTMGQGIALVLARVGIEVIAVEVNPARLDAGLENLRHGLEDRVKRGRMSVEQMDDELGRISGATELAALSDADLVIEAALEDMAIKKTIFAELDRICPPHAILTTNTSSLDIDEIAAATSRPDRVAGAHFFAPAQVMKLLELVRGKATSPITMSTLLALAERCGKVGVAVGNGPGFVANRMYHRYTWQAYFLLQEGVYPEGVDQAMQEFGFPLGCLAVGDISGQDVAWHVRKSQIASGFIDPAAPYPVIADRMCENGWFGRKTGRGWYLYEAGERKPNPDTHAMIDAVSAELGITRRAISADEIRERCLFALINEGARLLGLGMVDSSRDVDTIWRYGFGFPQDKTGPMHMAEEMGLERALETLTRLHHQHGPWFEPAPLIVDAVNNGKTSF
jgi:3-hydroxyacyl-CoA dehydrogenase